MATDALVELARAGLRFHDLTFVDPGGMLEVSSDAHEIEGIRIELPSRQYLGLQSIGVDCEGEDVANIAEVEVSSWWRNRADRFSNQRLFDFDHPSGLVVQTDLDDRPWIQVRFTRPLRVTRIRLRNAGDRTAGRARGIRILAAAAGSWQLLYDQSQRIEALDVVLDEIVRAQPSGGDLSAVVPVIALTVAGRYLEAFRAFEALDLPLARRRRIRSVISDELLAARSLEWTSHGPERSYRFWSDEEKQEYIQFTADVVTELTELTPNVCLGFGAALALVRDGDLIPHDDDLDLIVAFETAEAPTLLHGLRRLEDFLRQRGFTVTGTYSAHRHVSRRNQKYIDVFVGLFEGNAISWYPSPRRGLSRDVMFPPSEATLRGVSVPLPRSPLIYLERIYGPQWRNPDPDFVHVWDPTSYADLLGKEQAAKDPAGAS